MDLILMLEDWWQPAAILLLCLAVGIWISFWVLPRGKKTSTEPPNNVVSLGSALRERRRQVIARAGHRLKNSAKRAAKIIAVPAGLVVFVGIALFWHELQFYVFPETIEGRVTHVRDGDTIEVAGTPVRLSGVNCAERGTSLGNQATTAILSLSRDQFLTCRLNGEKTYERVVGRCTLPDGQDLGAALITEGVCGRCANFDRLRIYAGLQQEPYQGVEPDYCHWIW